ncbi:uncharacterized protein [Taeniopygia guttata]|uniref:uncharacterized protein n=1 Tax=Taeniopygia guttata TaxID=59729 RepID=UPI003BB96F4A
MLHFGNITTGSVQEKRRTKGIKHLNADLNNPILFLLKNSCPAIWEADSRQITETRCCLESRSLQGGHDRGKAAGCGGAQETTGGAGTGAAIGHSAKITQQKPKQSPLPLAPRLSGATSLSWGPARPGGSCKPRRGPGVAGPAQRPQSSFISCRAGLSRCRCELSPEPSEPRPRLPHSSSFGFSAVKPSLLIPVLGKRLSAPAARQPTGRNGWGVPEHPQLLLRSAPSGSSRSQQFLGLSRYQDK